MDFIGINNDTWKLQAAKAYYKPGCLWSEFEEDLSRALYIKRLISYYHNTGKLKERLILNHMVIWFNAFSTAGIPLLLFKMEERDLPVIKPFLFLLGRLPPVIEHLNTINIPHDPKVVEALNKL